MAVVVNKMKPVSVSSSRESGPSSLNGFDSSESAVASQRETVLEHVAAQRSQMKGARSNFTVPAVPSAQLGTSDIDEKLDSLQRQISAQSAKLDQVRFVLLELFFPSFRTHRQPFSFVAFLDHGYGAQDFEST